MPATELATAYISLVPSFKGGKAAITKGLDGAGAEAGSSAGRGFGSKFTSGIKGSTTAAASIIKTGFGAALGGGLALVGVAKFGNDLLTLGGQVSQYYLKSSTVFEGSAKGVEKWAARNAAALGMTKGQLVGQAAAFGDLIKPLGFTAEETAKMSKETVGLAGALSSWSGGKISAAEASDVLAKTMLGERDGLVALGIKISDADVQAKLAAKGQDKLTGSALEQAKAIATQELIFAKSTDAQKAWAAGGNKALASQNKLKAMTASFKETVAMKLTPVLTTAAVWLGTNLPKAGAQLQGWIKSARPTIDQLRAGFELIVAGVRERWPQIQKIVGDVVTTLRTVIAGFVSVATTLWRNFGNNILSFVQRAWNPIKGIVSGALTFVRGVIQTITSLIKGDWGGVWNGLKMIFVGAWRALWSTIKLAFEQMRMVVGLALEILGSMWKKAWEGLKALPRIVIDAVVAYVRSMPGRIRATVSTLWDGYKAAARVARDFVKNRLSDVVGFVRGLPDRLKAIAGRLKDALLAPFKAAFRAVASLWNSTVGKLSFKIPSWIPKVGGKSWNVPNIDTGAFDKYHSGGRLRRIPGRPGQEVPFVGLAGERVLSVAQTRMWEAGQGQGGRGPDGGAGGGWHFHGDTFFGDNARRTVRDLELWTRSKTPEVSYS